MPSLDTLAAFWKEITAAVAILDVLLVAVTIPWILAIKKESLSAIAWSLMVLLVPIGGCVLFVLFGYQSVYRPIARKRKQRNRFREQHGKEGQPKHARDSTPNPEQTWQGMAALALRLGAYPLYGGNRVAVYHDGPPAFDAMLAAIEAAEHHIHLQSYIFQYDELGKRVLALLEAKAKAGVQVRLLYDAIGTRNLTWLRLAKLRRAKGQAAVFLPLNILRRRIQINLRNHRKILVVDGKTGFCGGLNVGDEYLGKHPILTPWRDTHLKLEGPAVESLQRVFVEDWHFASGDLLPDGDDYFPQNAAAGDCPAQVVHSGPDQETKCIREILFAAIMRARDRLWITTPYYVPDSGIRDALTLAARSGVDVRLLCPHLPDHWIAMLAARYYWTDLLDAGVKVYQYTRGFVHAKVYLADGQWAMVGSSNLDNRSLHLNFECNVQLYSPGVVQQLEQQFERDLETTIRLDPSVYARRPLSGKLMENACRLLSPIL